MTASQIKAYGLWHVTTAGDCEGRSTRDLGTHEGFLDEIAFALASSAMYGLKFQKIDPTKYKDRPVHPRVDVQLDIGTGTWRMSWNQRVDFFRRMFADRPVTVRPSNFFASVELTSGRDPMEQERLRNEDARQTALSKLSPADIEALGLK